MLPRSKASIVICSFLLFSYYSGSLPISFKIDIIPSVWNFHLILTVRVFSNKSFYCIN